MRILIFMLCLSPFLTSAQSSKKPLDHSVYDSWKSVGERMISNDGNYAVYAVNPQEGDGTLYVQNLRSSEKVEIPRGYGAVITDDSKYVVFKIKPSFKDTRQAKIKKKKPDEMPKDSLAILELGKETPVKIARVKSFKTPEKAAGWVAYHMDKPLPDTAAKKRPAPDSTKMKIDMLTKLADSVIRKSLDSVKGNIAREEVIEAAKKAVKEIYKKADELEISLTDAEGDEAPGGAAGEGTDMILRNLSTGKLKTFKMVSEFQFDKHGRKLLVETSKNSKDSNSKAAILLLDLASEKADTILRGFNDAKGYAFDEDGKQLAFIAERDSSSKALQKFYKLWYHSHGKDSAMINAGRNTVGMKLGYNVSENYDPKFSKDGRKLFFGVAPIQPARDTNLVDFELARVDVWHYNDDYLQPQQLKQLSNEQKRSYLAVTNPGSSALIQLGDLDAENITLVDEGNADWVLAQSTKGNRISLQWEGRQRSNAYMINTTTGKRSLINEKGLGFYSVSPKGKYVTWYNPELKNYFAYNTTNGTVKNITAAIKEPLYDIENDVPDFPGAVGSSGWMADDNYVLINDVYDIWKVDPTGVTAPVNITAGLGKKNKMTFTTIKLDPEKRFYEEGDELFLGAFNNTTKASGYYSKKLNTTGEPQEIVFGNYRFVNPVKSKKSDAFLVQRMNVSESELFGGSSLKEISKLTNNAAQQVPYNWLTSELVKWKMLDGKMSEGILYKPENFDPKKKYPVIFYFYERDADNLYAYNTPAPSASTVNVAYFVSNGYLVFDPNIYYKTGEPGQSAYNSVVSAARYLSKLPYVDSTRMGIQGQSWGGYQVAYLITKTNMFRAAGAGAPVSNMTSAYGGIRWGTGLNRQFQYEKQQSRIGATLWQKPELYIRNSPLFYADKVNTPLLIMHNDADGAVPWYQGIEYFTALRRLGKKVWMLQYNGEDHNLVERKNRKDLSIRLSQFFDYYLKDAKPARWITEGLPATEKGRDWATDVP